MRDTLIEKLKDKYCERCDSITTIPGDMINPPETNCHCDFDFTDPACSKSATWQEIESHLKAIEELMGE